MATPPLETGNEIAEHWRRWCGDTPWSRAMDEFGNLGGLVEWWCGYPRCASAIPLTFSLHDSNGEELPIEQNYRLKDIRSAIKFLTTNGAGA